MHTIIWPQRRDCLRDVGMYGVVIVIWVAETGCESVGWIQSVSRQGKWAELNMSLSNPRIKASLYTWMCSVCSSECGQNTSYPKLIVVFLKVSPSKSGRVPSDIAITVHITWSTFHLIQHYNSFLWTNVVK